ncbi:MAG: YiiX/YebB-like N1pC/P60 family cysteine hydrolase [Flavobacteriales bacterium]
MLKRTLLFLNLVLIVGTLVAVATLKPAPVQLAKDRTSELRDGDIVFQQTGGEQGRAVQLATGSPWTHVGVLFMETDRWMVYEAVGPVRSIPLEKWVTHGTDGRWVAKRWVDAGTEAPQALRSALKKAGARFNGLPYDLEFRWNDDRMYCSELVWKMYAEGVGVRLCEPKPMRDHALGSPAVQQVMRERYGSTPPLDEPMIAPGALFDCPLVRTVVDG